MGLDMIGNELDFRSSSPFNYSPVLNWKPKFRVGYSLAAGLLNTALFYAMTKTHNPNDPSELYQYVNANVELVSLGAGVFSTALGYYTVFKKSPSKF